MSRTTSEFQRIMRECLWRSLSCLLLSVSVAAGANVSAQALPKWTATRELRIDGEAQSLVPVGRLVVDRSGRIYVMQTQDRNIRVFNADGLPERTIGRKGSGPGEFEFLGNIGLFGDTLWASHGSPVKVTLFGAGPKPIRSFELKNVRSERIRMEPLVYALHRSSSVVAMVLAGVPRIEKRTLEMVRASRDGRHEHTYATRSYVEGFPYGGSSYDGGAWRFGADHNPPIWATSDDGERVGVAVSALDGPDAGYGTLTMHNFKGDTLFTRRFQITLKSIPDSVIDAQLDELEKKPGHVPNYRSLPRPEYYPPLEYMRIARNGAVLLAFYAHGSERDFLMINAEGHIVSSLTLPKNVIVKFMEGDLLWGVERDDNDVESIVRYRINRS